MLTEAQTFLPDFLRASYSEQKIIQLNRYILANTLVKPTPGDRTLILLSGGSGTGKDTLVNELTKSPHPNLGEVKRIPTCTSRTEIRPDEVADDPYIRLTREQFRDGVEEGHFLETNPYANNSDLYGTRAEDVAKVLSQSHGVLRMDPNGARAIMKLKEEGHPLFENVAITYLFMVPDSMDSLEQRLLTRYRAQYDEETARRKTESRMVATVNDMQSTLEAHYIVVNHQNEFPEVFNAVSNLLG